MQHIKTLGLVILAVIAAGIIVPIIAGFLLSCFWKEDDDHWDKK